MSAATSCPNRTDGAGGCIFCSAGGSGEFAAAAHLSVEQQLESAKRRVAEKFDGNRFIAYFQSYTGTYGNLAALERIYTEAAERSEVAVLSIATRPDCLGEQEMAMLRRLAAIKPLWIELGLQTENDATACQIRRGYPTEEYVRATERLRGVAEHIITHVILGLPGEDRAQMVRSALCAARHSDGIKLQLLHVLRDTALEQLYRQGAVHLLSAEEYYETVADVLEALPEGTVVHRLTGDGDKRLLIAPLWSADKKKVRAQMERVLRARGFIL